MSKLIFDIKERLLNIRETFFGHKNNVVDKINHIRKSATQEAV